MPRNDFFLGETGYVDLFVFFFGAFLVLAKWAKVGILIEFVGFINLFGDFFPYLVNFARQLPLIGPILTLPLISHVLFYRSFSLLL